MSDMLVNLYELPKISPHLEKLRNEEVIIRIPIAYEKHKVVEWVRNTFGPGWASECDVSFSNHPISCFIATERGNIVGFACYDSTCKNFFGPIGIAGQARGRGIGKALLLACLQAMAANGYAYAIIGKAHPAEFYARTVGAIEIEGSRPGFYPDPLK
jgi:ribosomal protein S18 acetylase RimI-like enzyme